MALRVELYVFLRARIYLGGSLATVGRLDEAIRHLREAVRLSPGDPDATRNLAAAQAPKGSVQTR